MKKNIFIGKEGAYSRGTITFGGFILAIVFPICTMAETTSVSNSVSISSTGSGASHASVKTSINGVVVEDRTVEGSGAINSHIETVNGSTTVRTLTEDQSTPDTELLMLLQKLKTLLDYYVSLLNAHA